MDRAGGGATTEAGSPDAGRGRVDRGPSASLWGWKLVTLAWGLCAITNTVPLFIYNQPRFRDTQVTRVSKISNHFSYE